MKNIPQKYLTYALAIALIVVVCLLLSDSCSKAPKDHSVEKEIIDRGDKQLRDSLELYKQFDRDKSLKIAGMDSTIREIRKVAEVRRAELNRSNSTAIQLRNELRGYRNMDTGYVNIRIDSLLNEVDNLTFLLADYTRAVDSLSIAIDQQKENYESLAAKRAELLTQIRTQYETVNKGYQNLFSTNQGLQRSLKREKLKTKIAAVIALVEGILLAVK
jgi:chromosome segregation ATPase